MTDNFDRSDSGVRARRRGRAAAAVTVLTVAATAGTVSVTFGLAARLSAAEAGPDPTAATSPSGLQGTQAIRPPATAPTAAVVGAEVSKRKRNRPAPPAVPRTAGS